MSTVETNRYYSDWGRTSGVLSDGTAVHCYVSRNSSGGNPLIRVYHSSDRVTWTQKASFDVSATNKISDESPSGMTVDESDNIHFVWTSSNTGSQSNEGEVCYVKFAKGGGYTWTAGSIEVVKTNNTAHHVTAVDVDVLVASTNLVAVFYSYYTTGASFEYVAIRRTSSPAWVNTELVSSGSSSSFYYLSISRGSGTTVGVSTAGNSVRDAYVKALSVTASSGAISQTFTSTLSGVNGGSRLMLFCTGTSQWTAIGTKAGGGSHTPIAGRFNATAWTIAVTEGPPLSQSTYGIENLLAYIQSGDLTLQRGLVGYVGMSDSKTHAVISKFTSTAITFSPISLFSTDRASGGGNNRNLDKLKIDLLGNANTATNVTSITNPTPSPPTFVGPSGAVATSTPTLTATMPASTPRVKAKWQVALNSGFTSSLKTIIDPDTDFISSGVTTEIVPEADRLSKTTWFLRAYAVNELGQESTPIAYVTMNVSYQPSATNLIPNGGTMAAYDDGDVFLNWDFSSPDSAETQTAYQVIVEENATGDLIVDTGKVASGTTEVTVAIAAGYKELTLRWKVRVWDVEDTVSEYSAYALFVLGDPPDVTIDTPVDASEVNNPSPAVTWTPTFFGGRTQKLYQVVFYEQPSGDVVHNSGIVASTDTSYVPPSGILENDGSYTVRLVIMDTGDLFDSTSNDFTTEWIPPDAPTLTISATSYDELGYVRLSWPTTGIVDSANAGWRVYRRISGESEWVLLDSVLGTTGTLIYDDRFAASNVAYDYGVRQVANRFGSLIESDPDLGTGSVTPPGTHYWLLHPTDLTLDVLLWHVVSDSFNEEYETAVTPLLGRGRKIDYGDRWGFSGSLTAEFRDRTGLTARQMLIDLKTLKAQRGQMYLRNPFGDVWLVEIEDISVGRLAGVGGREFVDVTIPYKELSSE